MKINYFLIQSLSLFLSVFSMDISDRPESNSMAKGAIKKWYPQSTPVLNFKLCHHSDLKILEKFLKLGARPDDFKQGLDCPLLKALKDDKFDKFKLFLKYKSKDFDILIFHYGPALLHDLVIKIASIHGGNSDLVSKIQEIIEILLLNGACPNFITKGSGQEESALVAAKKVLSEKESSRNNISQQESQFAYEIAFSCGVNASMRMGAGRVINLDRQIFRLHEIIKLFEKYYPINLTLKNFDHIKEI